jgi:hypothetical protein
VAEIVEIDRQAARLAGALPAEYGELVASHRDRTVLGGGAWALLAGLDRSRVVLPGAGGQRPVPNARGAATLQWLADRLARNTDGQLGPHIQDLLQLMTARRAAQDRLREDLRLQAWLDIWLWFHVPLAFGLLAALLAHVVAVFLYW